MDALLKEVMAWNDKPSHQQVGPFPPKLVQLLAWDLYQSVRNMWVGALGAIGLTLMFILLVCRDNDIYTLTNIHI